jgi:hypothetical protein
LFGLALQELGTLPMETGRNVLSVLLALALDSATFRSVQLGTAVYLRKRWFHSSV